MDYLWIVIVIVLVMLNAYVQASKEVAAKQADHLVETVVKVCPPHRWNYKEVKDQEGNFVKWRMVCDLCGPLKPLDGSKG